MFIRVSRQGPGAALLQQPHQISSRNQFAFTAWANTRVVTHYAEQDIMLFQETLDSGGHHSPERSDLFCLPDHGTAST